MGDEVKNASKLVNDNADYLTEKYKVMDIIISIPVIINIKILNPSLSIKYPHKNLEDPLTIPKNTPR